MATMVRTYWDTSKVRNGYAPIQFIEFSNDYAIFEATCEYHDGFLVLDRLDPKDQIIKECFELLCGCFEKGCNFNDSIKDIFGPEASVDTICIHVFHIPVIISYIHHDLATIYKSWRDDFTKWCKSDSSFGSHKKAN